MNVSPWHVGVLVADLDRAVVELEASLGTGFTPPATVHFAQVDDPDPRSVDIRVAFSRGPNPKLELIESLPRGIYATSEHGSGLHHLGYWEDDIDANYERRLGTGATCVARVVAPGGGLVAWYATTPETPGVLMEFIDARSRAAVEAFVATGDPAHLS